MSAVKLKVYNKQGKLKVIVREDDSSKVITICQYEEGIEHMHSFVHIDESKTYRADMHPYYEYMKMVDGIIKEKLSVSNNAYEHDEMFGEGEMVRTTKNLISGNVYQNRKKNFQGGYAETIFKNEELIDWNIPFSENKIEEYLQKLSDG